MTDFSGLKTAFQHQVQGTRNALLWKLDGLSKRDVRLPRTPTGTSLLGVVKHMASVGIGEFGDTFGRSWPAPDERIPDAELDANPQADWFATATPEAGPRHCVHGR